MRDTPIAFVDPSIVTHTVLRAMHTHTHGFTDIWLTAPRELEERRAAVMRKGYGVMRSALRAVLDGGEEDDDPADLSVPPVLGAGEVSCPLSVGRDPGQGPERRLDLSQRERTGQAVYSRRCLAALPLPAGWHPSTCQPPQGPIRSVDDAGGAAIDPGVVAEAAPPGPRGS